MNYTPVMGLTDLTDITEFRGKTNQQTNVFLNLFLLKYCNCKWQMTNDNKWLTFVCYTCKTTSGMYKICVRRCHVIWGSAGVAGVTAVRYRQKLAIFPRAEPKPLEIESCTLNRNIAARYSEKKRKKKSTEIFESHRCWIFRKSRWAGQSEIAYESSWRGFKPLVEVERGTFIFSSCFSESTNACTIWNRMRPRALVQNQQTKGNNSAHSVSDYHNSLWGQRVIVCMCVFVCWASFEI